MCGVPFLPEKLRRPQEHPRPQLPAHDIRPLVQQEGEVAIGRDPLRHHLADDRLRRRPDDERFWPLYERCEELGLALLFHTGTSGIGAGQPGGQGIGLDYARPIRLDAVAAAFPSLNVIAAHFGYPWHLELLAMALHKTNIHIDISGWAPKYIPAEVIREMKGRLQNQFVFGSDYPFIQPQRCLDELATMDIPEAALHKVLTENGRKLLGLS